MSAYSRSLHTVRVMQEALTALLDHPEGYEWTVPEGDAWRFAYRMREALYAAKYNADATESLATLGDRFRIKVKLPSLVAAEPIIGHNDRTRVMAPGRPEAAPAPLPAVGGLPPAPSGAFRATTAHGGTDAAAITVPGPQSPSTVVSIWLELQLTAPRRKIYFPEAGLDEVELAKVARWAATRDADTGGWLVIPSNASILLHPFDADLVDLAWHEDSGGSDA